jgi:hypothetical protein
VGTNVSDLEELRILRPLRTRLALFIVQHLTRPRPLVIRAWFWLAAEAQATEGKRRCLNAILDPDPDSEPAS